MAPLSAAVKMSRTPRRRARRLVSRTTDQVADCSSARSTYSRPRRPEPRHARASQRSSPATASGTSAWDAAVASGAIATCRTTLATYAVCRYLVCSGIEPGQQEHWARSRLRRPRPPPNSRARFVRRCRSAFAYRSDEPRREAFVEAASRGHPPHQAGRARFGTVANAHSLALAARTTWPMPAFASGLPLAPRAVEPPRIVILLIKGQRTGVRVARSLCETANIQFAISHPSQAAALREAGGDYGLVVSDFAGEMLAYSALT